MPWMKWLPWRFFIRRFALAHGFLDPIALVARMQRFAEPSEVAEPIELLRAGVIFHARGLINSRVIQHNLDWVWPYWIERQFDPHDDAFIPRAFSITHCNLSHRNWTAIGWPDNDNLPLIDPRGLLTPHYDSWSVDAWIIDKSGDHLFPSKCGTAKQSLGFEQGVSVTTSTQSDNSKLTGRARVELENGVPVCRLALKAKNTVGGYLAIALRPFNSEGISFINKINFDYRQKKWIVNGEHPVLFSDAPDRHLSSCYRDGDVRLKVDVGSGLPAGQARQECDVGMATAAALFELFAGQEREISVNIPLPHTEERPLKLNDWEQQLQPACRINIPDKQQQFLFESAVRTLILHSPDDVFPGPYTYKRFWFRDAAFIIQALLHINLTDRAERALERFLPRQKQNGFFHSQDGEWDSNGEAIWIMTLFTEMTNTPAKPRWLKAIIRGARWITRKRLDKNPDNPHAGLLPAGFSAEHLGPNDYYYWDDFWGIAGLQSAALFCRRAGETALAEEFNRQADDFMQSVERSLARVEKRLGHRAMPASPYRRMDPGAVGSIVAGYPLQLLAPENARLVGTGDYLYRNCLVKGGFFQDMIHSGINPYLTLHVAQVLLRAGDERYRELIDTVAGIATSTGQWPEAVHPRTGGGCMGDGQHVWAAAEWVVMLRNCFLREEDRKLIIASGIPADWVMASNQDNAITFGPAPTRFGMLNLKIYMTDTDRHVARIEWQADWHAAAPEVEIRLGGASPFTVSGDMGSTDVANFV